jgi:inorganic pyrophosphatase
LVTPERLRRKKIFKKAKIEGWEKEKKAVEEYKKMVSEYKKKK